MPSSRAKEKTDASAPSPEGSIDPAMKFEQAMAELEQIVGEMEDAELPLESLIERYERGVRLAQLCEVRLAEAEQKVEVLTSGGAGEPAEKSPAPPADEPDEGEVRLF